MTGPAVFLSSTYVDLAETRDTVFNYLASMKFIPRLFEKGGIGFQTDRPLDEDCYEAVSECDYYILLIGNRYGSPASSTDGSSSARKFNSVTKMEFERAHRDLIPMFIFVKSEVRAAYQTYKKNKFNSNIEYEGIDDVQILELLRDVYRRVGSTSLIADFTTGSDVVNHLAAQFAAVIKESAKLRRAKKVTTLTATINPFKLRYFLDQAKINKKELSQSLKIPRRKIEELQRITPIRGQYRPLNQRFPSLPLAEAVSMEKALDCDGQLMGGKADDLHTHYLSHYYKFNRSVAAKDFPSSFTGNGFRVKTVIFDFDGTVSYNPDGLTTWEILWTMLGYTREECAKYHRLYRRKELSHEGWCNLTADKFRAQGMTRATLDLVLSRIIIRDQARETFKHLYEAGLSLHILSGSIDYVIKESLKDHTYVFKAIYANSISFDDSGVISSIRSTPYDFEGKADYVAKVINEEKVHPLEVLYVGNSANDVWVANSGARTLCVDPKLTDPDGPLQWCDKIVDFASMEDVLPFVYKGSDNL